MNGVMVVLIVLMIILIVITLVCIVSIIALTKKIRHTKENVNTISDRIAVIDTVVSVVSAGAMARRVLLSKTGIIGRRRKKNRRNYDKKENRKARR